MSTTITAAGSPTFKHSTTGPSDGPTAHASDVNSPFQDVLDNTEYLYQATHGFWRVVGMDDIPYNVANGRSSTSSTPTAVPGASITIACKAGDKVDVAAMMLINNNGTAHNARVQVYVSENGGGFVAEPATANYNLASATLDGFVPLSCVHRVAADGNVIVKIYSWSTDGATAADCTVQAMRAIAYRAAAA